MPGENVDLALRMYEVFNRRDLDAMLALMHDEVEIEPRLGALEGDYRGHAGVRRWWSDLLDFFPDYAAEIVEVQDLGDMTLGQIRGRAPALRAPRPSSRLGGSRSGGATVGASGGATSRRKLTPSKPLNWRRDDFSIDRDDSGGRARRALPG
jgi:SnoaL-like protein